MRFQEGERAGTLRVLTKHVIQPSEQEMMGNPRFAKREAAVAEECRLHSGRQVRLWRAGKKLRQ